MSVTRYARRASRCGSIRTSSSALDGYYVKLYNRTFLPRRLSEAHTASGRLLWADRQTTAAATEMQTLNLDRSTPGHPQTRGGESNWPPPNKKS